MMTPEVRELEKAVLRFIVRSMDLRRYSQLEDVGVGLSDIGALRRITASSIDIDRLVDCTNKAIVTQIDVEQLTLEEKITQAENDKQRSIQIDRLIVAGASKGMMNELFSLNAQDFANLRRLNNVCTRGRPKKSVLSRHQRQTLVEKTHALLEQYPLRERASIDVASRVILTLCELTELNAAEVWEVVSTASCGRFIARERIA